MLGIRPGSRPPLGCTGLESLRCAARLRPRLRLGVIALSLAVATSAGCASIREVDPAEGTVELGPNEGLIAVHVATDTPIERIQVSGFKVGEPFDDGSRLWFLIASPGKHKFDRVYQSWAGVDMYALLVDRQASFSFDVEAGRINYPGLLLVEKVPVNKVGWIPIYVYMTNRSAMLLEELEETHPELVERYPIRYAGQEEDRFFEVLDAARAAARGDEAAP